MLWPTANATTNRNPTAARTAGSILTMPHRRHARSVGTSPPEKKHRQHSTTNPFLGATAVVAKMATATSWATWASTGHLASQRAMTKSIVTTAAAAEQQGHCRHAKHERDPGHGDGRAPGIALEKRGNSVDTALLILTALTHLSFSPSFFSWLALHLLPSVPE